MPKRHRAELTAFGFLAGLLAAYMTGGNNSVPIRLGIFVLTAALATSIIIMIRASGRSGSFRLRAVLLILLSMLSALSYGSIYISLTESKIAGLSASHKTVTLKGMVLSSSTDDRSLVTVYGSAEGVVGKYIFYTEEGLPPGSVILVSGELKAAADNSYYRHKGILAVLSKEGDARLLPGGIVSKGYFMISELRQAITDTVMRELPFKSGRLINAMLTGDTEYLPDDLRISMNRSGVGHILAVSGLHVSILSGALIGLMSILRAGKWLTLCITMTSMSLYIALTGLRISSLRALFMIFVYLIGRALGREYTLTSSLGFSVTALLILMPYSCCDPSLLLSASGVIGAGYLAPLAIRALGVSGRVKKALILSLFASLGSAPGIAVFFDELSLIAPLANAVILPLCPVMLILSMLYSLMGGSSFLLPLIKLAGLIASLIIRLCEWLGSCRLFYLPCSPGLILGTVAAALITALYYILTLSKRKAVILSLFLSGATVLAAFISTLAGFNAVRLDLIGHDGEFLLVLRQGNSCVAVASGGGLDAALQRRLYSLGIDNILLAAVVSDGQFSPGELKSSCDTVYMSCSPAASEPVISIGQEGFAEAFGLELYFYRDCVKISDGRDSLTVRRGWSPGDSELAFFFDGVAVIRRDGGARAYSEDVWISLRLK